MFFVILAELKQQLCFLWLLKHLAKQGFKIKTISEGNNPIYAIKYAENEHPIIGFSKTYDDDFNPER